MSRRPRSGMLLALGGSAALLAGIAAPMGVTSQAGASPQIQPASASSSAWAVIGTISASLPSGTAIDVGDDTVYFAATDISAAAAYIGAISAGSTSGAADDSVTMPQVIWFLAADSDDDSVYATPVRGTSFSSNQNGILYEVNGRTMSLDDSSLPRGTADIGYDRYLTQPGVDNDDDSVYIGANGLNPEVYVKGFSGWQTIATLTGDSANNFAVNQSDDTLYVAWPFDSKVTASSGLTLSPAVTNRTVLFPYGLSVNSLDDSVYALGPTLGPGPSVVQEYSGRDFSSARSVALPSIGNRTVSFLSLASDGTRLVASERTQSSGAQIYLINSLTMTVDDTVITGTATSEGNPQITSSGLIYAPTESGIKVIAKLTGPGGSWSGSAGNIVTASLTPTPNVVNGRTITVDDSTVTSVSFGDDTTAFNKTGNSLSITVPPGTGTVSVTARLNGGNFVALGTFTYPSTPTPPVPADPPSAPLNAAATAGDASATITWSPPASQGSFPVTNYKVTSSPGGKVCLVTAPATSCTIVGLTNGTAYTFTVQALNGAGWSPTSASTAPVTPASTPTPTIVITGSRGTGEGRIGRVVVQGVTTYLAGALVQARVHLAGEVDYYDGSTRRIQENNTFTWQRLTKKKVYVYFTTEDRTVRSNRLIIDP
jgi:hypothetical protein